MKPRTLLRRIAWLLVGPVLAISEWFTDMAFWLMVLSRRDAREEYRIKFGDEPESPPKGEHHEHLRRQGPG